MNNQYLIPANSNKSRLILGFFTPIDLIIFGTGVMFTLVMLFVFKSNSLGVLVMILSPALISAFLVMPVPHYHNIMTLIGNIYRFYTGIRRFYWRGWCMHYGEK